LLLMAVGVASPAFAGPFDIQQFHPAVTSGGYFNVDGAFVPAHLSFHAALTTSYAHDPLVLSANGKTVDLVSHQVGLEPALSLALFGRLEIGAALPFLAYQSTDNSLGLIPGGLPTAAMGDMRFDLKILVAAGQFGDHRLALSVVGGMTAPSSTGKFAGDND